VSGTNVSVELDDPSGADVFVSVHRPGTTGDFVVVTPFAVANWTKVVLMFGATTVNGSSARLNVKETLADEPGCPAFSGMIVVTGVGDCVRLSGSKRSFA
jgi:hypothetical protein